MDYTTEGKFPEALNQFSLLRANTHQKKRTNEQNDKKEV